MPAKCRWCGRHIRDEKVRKVEIKFTASSNGFFVISDPS